MDIETMTSFDKKEIIITPVNSKGVAPSTWMRIPIREAPGLIENLVKLLHKGDKEYIKTIIKP